MLLLAGAAALVGALAVHLQSERSAAAFDAPAAGGALRLPVEMLRVEMQDSYEVKETYADKVFADQESELGFERGGRLVEVVVDEGAQVRKGPAARPPQHRPAPAAARSS